MVAADKYIDDVVPGGQVFVDSSLIEQKVIRNDVEAYYIPATQIASDENLPGLANMIILGLMIKKSGIMPFENIEKALSKVVSAKKANLLELNKKAIQIGYDYE